MEGGGDTGDDDNGIITSTPDCASCPHSWSVVIKTSCHCLCIFIINRSVVPREMIEIIIMFIMLLLLIILIIMVSGTTDVVPIV